MFLPSEMKDIINRSFARMDSISKTYANNPGIDSLTPEQIAEFNKLLFTLNKCANDLQTILDYYAIK